MKRSSIPGTLEIVSVVVSAVTFAILVFVLSFNNGKEIFSFYRLTLNTIVSILATISKAALLLAVDELLSRWKWILFTDESRPLIDFERIDAASRGPGGSFLLLFSGSRVSYTHIGACVILFSLAVDPLAQQIIQTRQKQSWVDDDTVTVKRAGRYSQGFITASYLNGIAATADLGMKSAILYGASQPLESVNSQTPFQCPSGSFSWPSYESLAVCAQCRDLTSSLELKVGVPEPLKGSNITVTYFTLPNGLGLGNLNGTGHLGALDGTYFAVSFGTGNATATMTMQDLDLMIWSMSIIQIDAESVSSSVLWPKFPVVATECALSYCVNTYQDKVVNGSFQPSTVPVANAYRVPQPWQITEWLAGLLGPGGLTSIEFDPNMAFLRTDLSIVSPDTGNGYNLSVAAVWGISSFIGNDTLMNRPIANATDPTNGWCVLEQSDTLTYSLAALRDLCNSTNLNATFTALASSMNNAIRVGADETFNGTSWDHTGQRLVATTVNAITWPYITLHALLTIVAPIFLMLTIRNKSNPSQVGRAWKSSSLATLSRGPVVQDLLEGAHTVEEMQERAKNTKVTLLLDSRGPSGEKVEHMELDPLQMEHDPSDLEGRKSSRLSPAIDEE
ncbi:hypothetical protein F5Y16DRAFT_382150 [Xylariaceae sp. FL0255]|nr:hypothetical protein F5Y16DRAFT_382150 [Xylariaceae sp. FL0255]